MKRKRKRTVKMKKDDAKNLMFYQWINENWLISGGLITKATAARILNRTTGRISQMVREGKLIEHRFNNEISFVRFAQVREIAEKLSKMIESPSKASKKSASKKSKI